MAEDARGRDDGVERNKGKKSPSHPLADFSLSVKDTAREMSTRGMLQKLESEVNTFSPHSPLLSILLSPLLISIYILDNENRDFP